MPITKKLIIPGAITLAAFLGAAGSTALSSLAANAATDSSISTTQSVAANDTQQPKDPSQGGHVGTNGTKEVLLTGDIAEKVKAAALAKVPGGTIQRVENDAEGSPYEAHMLQSDGTPVTIKVDASFNATSVETGGPGGHGGPAQGTQQN